MASQRNTLADEPIWGEYDFTTFSPNRQNLAATGTCFDTQAAIDGLDYPNVMDDYEDPNATPTMYQTAPFRFSDLQEMGSDASPSNRTSQSTSRSHPYSIPAKIRIGQPSLPLSSEKVCPLLAGQALQCTPQRCGPEAACLDLSNLPDLEDGTSVPCTTEELSNRSDLPQTFEAPPVAISDTLLPPSSASPSKKPAGNSRQRLQRTNSDDANVKPGSKKAHLLVERRYRENLNGNIAQLHMALLETKRVGTTMPKRQGDDPEEQRQAWSKVRKSDVMLDAVDYVHQTEVELRHMADEIGLLTARVRQIEKLVKCEDCVLMKQLVNFGM